MTYHLTPAYRVTFSNGHTYITQIDLPHVLKVLEAKKPYENDELHELALHNANYREGYWDLDDWLELSGEAP